jgi:hypothetical protein
MASRDTPSTPLEPCPKTQGVKRALSCASLSLEEHPRSKHCPVQPGDLGGFDAHALPAGSDDSEWYAAADASGGNVTRGSGCFAASSDIEDSFDGRLIRSLPPLIDDGSWDGDAEDYVEVCSELLKADLSQISRRRIPPMVNMIRTNICAAQDPPGARRPCRSREHPPRSPIRPSRGIAHHRRPATL